MKKIETTNGSVIYLNSGDWVENLTALEYHNNRWKLYRFEADFIINDDLKKDLEEDHEEELLENKVLFQNLIKEFQTGK
jgi:hypothetical protein